MGSLVGTLDVMALPDLLLWLANRGKSGRLSVVRGPVTKHVYVVNGEATQSFSDDPRERLGQHLLNFGYVNDAQLHTAFQTQVQTGVPLGRVLVLSGVLDEPRLMRVLSFKTRECLLDAFDWETGNFEFRSDESVDPALDTPPPTHLAELHSEGLSRRTMWEEIRKVLPGTQSLLDVRQPVPQDINPFDRRLLDHAAAGRTVGEVALEVRALDFHVFARFYDLVGRGLARPRPPGSRAPNRAATISMPAVVPAAREELLLQLRTKVQAGATGEAQDIARRVLERDPHDAEAQAVMGAVDAEAPRAAAAVAAEFLPTSVPQLAMTRGQLDEYLLTSKERYVLSRIDGKRTVAQVMGLSPIPEQELSRILGDFVRRGLVRV
jgi:hypothetical protein